MTTNFVNLPSTIISRVCKFVEGRSLLRMREACKVNKEVVDNLISTTRTVVQSFEIARSAKNKISVVICIKSKRDYLLWKIALFTSFNKLGLDCSNIFIPFVFLKQMFVSLKSTEELEKVFGLLKPLTQRVQFDVLSMRISEPQINRLCCDFLDGKIIEQFTVDPRCSGATIDFAQCLHFVRNLKPASVIIYEFGTKLKGSTVFILKLAEMVKELKIEWNEGCNESLRQKIPLSLVRAILTCKCERLQIEDEINAYSIEDAEKLIQIFHHIGKRVHFESWADADLLEAEVGEYKIKTIDVGLPARGRRIVIKHSEL